MNRNEILFIILLSIIIIIIFAAPRQGWTMRLISA